MRKFTKLGQNLLLAAMISGPAWADGETWNDLPGDGFAPAYQSDEWRAYDFWVGEWWSNWRPREEDGLGHVLEGNRQHQFLFTILGGKALVELAQPLELDPDTPSGRGFSIRYRDGETGGWIMAQHWPNPGFDGAAFTDQLMGDWDGDRVQLYSHDIQRSTPEAVSVRRYSFTDIDHESIRWEGANTEDGGNSWSTWMVVDIHRMADYAPAAPRDQVWPGTQNRLLCADDAHRAFDGIAGRWSLSVELASGQRHEGRFDAAAMLDGCATAGLMRWGGHEYFLGWSWAPIFGSWVTLSLSDIPGERHQYAISPGGGEGSTFIHAPDLTISSQSQTYYRGLGTAASAGMSRIRYEEIGEARMVWIREIRDDAESAWREDARFVFTRD